MQFSYSRVGTFKQCPYKFKLGYIDELTTISDPDANDPGVVGGAMHMGMETDIPTMLEYYYNHYPLITDTQVNEAIKLEILAARTLEILQGVNIYKQEYVIDFPEFKGIVDLMTLNEDGSIDIFDFKYSNNVDRYMDSAQLHIYKYFLEKQGFKIGKLGFIFIPKTFIRQKKVENLYQFRKRLLETLDTLSIQIKEVEYQVEKVNEFLSDCQEVLEATEYPKAPSKLCDWCDFKNYCEKGETYMLLPKNEKREINLDQGVKVWLYGAPFVGKSYLANQFPDALFLNTDGNVKFIDSPYVAIKDDIKVEGRIKTKILAWDTFTSAIDEVVAGNHDFKTIVVDLLDDCYEAARLKTYDKLGVEHEHDAGFGKGYDMVKTEFLPALRKLTNTKYNVILISHEVVSEFAKKNGEKLSTVSTPLGAKVANKLSGMVDVVARITDEPGEGRTLNFKNTTTVFGGGRLNFEAHQIPCDYLELMKQYDKAVVTIQGAEKPKVEEANEEKPKKTRARKAAAADAGNVEETGQAVQKETGANKAAAETGDKTPGATAEKNEEAPKKRTRKKKEV